MNTATKIAGFTAGLVVVFGAAFALGSTVGPFNFDNSSHSARDTKPHIGTPVLPRGLDVSAAGYTLRPEQTPTQPEHETELRFTITGPSGKALTKFTKVHDKDLHVIVVRRDLAHYQHLHPVMDASGMWKLPVSVAAAGQYRLFADFQPAGYDSALTLGTDFTVNGDYDPISLPAPVSKVTVDGYEVELTGRLVAAKTSKLVLTVTKDGQDVTDLEPYLGAYGHLVALRQNDVAYLHVHPDGKPVDGKTKAGPHIGFHIEVPSATNYRLYLDFQHNGAVHTAEFTARASEPKETSEPPEHGKHEHE